MDCNTVQLANISANSVSIYWKTMNNINETWYAYYGYQVEYRQEGLDTSWTSQETIEHSALFNESDMIYPLIHNAYYSIRLRPVRLHQGVVDWSQTCHIDHVKTLCIGKSVPGARPRKNPKIRK